MIYSIRSLSRCSLSNIKITPQINCRRESLPCIPAKRQFHSFVETILATFNKLKEKSFEENLQGKITRLAFIYFTGMRPLNAEETKQAIINHQKLWVTCYSVDNFFEASEHFELFYSMQLFKNRKDASMQQHYLSLIQKEESRLSLEDLQELIDLYQFALDSNPSPLFVSSLRGKKEKYQTLLHQKQHLKLFK